MRSARCFGDVPTECREPNWQPLLDLVPEHVVEGFMWMYRTELDDGSVVHAYKHSETRRYVFLGEDGRGYTYCRGGRYQIADPERQLRYATRGVERG
jgi:hypothetical protein